MLLVGVEVGFLKQLFLQNVFEEKAFIKKKKEIYINFGIFSSQKPILTTHFAQYITYNATFYHKLPLRSTREKPYF